MRMKTYKSPSPRMRRANGSSQEHLPGPGHPAKAPYFRPLERLPLQQHSRRKLQAPDDRPGLDVRPLEDAITKEREAGQSYKPRPTSPARTTGHSQDPDDRPHPDDRASDHRTESAYIRRTPDVRDPAILRTTGPLRTPDRSAPEPNLRKSEEHRTSGPSRASGRPEPSGRPTPVCAQCVGPQPMYPFTYPFVALDYIYSSTSS